MKTKEDKVFQSFLIIGEHEQAEEEKNNILLKIGVEEKPASPDFYRISPEKNSISIEEIRNFKKHIFQKPLKYQYKVVVIESSEKLTKEAQNALLKILEEPPAHAIIILLCANIAGILPTILSRVVKLYAKNKDFKTQEEPFWQNNLTENLKKIAEVETPTLWIDNQIMLLYKNLLDKIKEGQKSKTYKIARTLELFRESKKMILQNVHPKFTLTNLILETSTDDNLSFK